MIIPTYFRTTISRKRLSKLCLYKNIFKEYSISFLMVCRSTDFALVVFKLLMFKVGGIIGISEIEFFNFSGTKGVEQNKKNKNDSKPPKLVSQSVFK